MTITDTPRMTAALEAARKKTRQIENRGGRGGGLVCTGCVLCDRPGIIAHYPPKRPVKGHTRVVYVDCHGVIYDEYWPAAEASEWLEAVTHPRQPGKLPNREPYWEIRSTGAGKPLRIAELKRAVQRLALAAIDTATDDPCD
jgi:hypothetical protein